MRFDRLSPSLRLFPLLCAAALLAGCSDDAPAEDDGSETTNAGSTAGTDGATTDADADAGDGDGDADTDTDTDPSTDEGNFVSDEGPDEGTTDVPPGNLGDQCMSDGDCAEDLFCNGVPGFGGVCSECASDSDCPDGSNCTFSGGWFACGDGSLGQMCESDASCAEGSFCAEVIDLGGFFNGNFCSECADDSHCPDGQLCAPMVEFMDIMNIGGQRVCIDPGTLPNDSLCDADGAGDEQCEGFCTTADLMGFIELGVCGECETNMHCQGQSMCMPGMVGLEGFSGSFCG